MAVVTKPPILDETGQDILKDFLFKLALWSEVDKMGS